MSDYSYLWRAARDARPCIRCGDTTEPIEVPCEVPRCEDYRACVERAKRGDEPVTEPGRPALADGARLTRAPLGEVQATVYLDERALDRERYERSITTPRKLDRSDNGWRWCHSCSTPVPVAAHECAPKDLDWHLEPSELER